MSDAYVYSQDTERKIGASSAAALAQLENASAEDRQKMKAMRDRLYSWLVRVGEIVTNPRQAVGVELAAMLDEHLQEQLVKIDSPESKAVLSAWSALPDAQALELVGSLVGRLFGSSSQGLLVSRQAPELAWAATGFHFERPMKTVFAKVGDEPFQPIGYDDDQHYLPTSGSKTLWCREWAMAVLLPFGPAFEVSQEEAKPQEISDAVALSERERERMIDICSWLDDDIQAWKRLVAEAEQVLALPKAEIEQAAKVSKARRDEQAFKIRESVKLARIQLPRLEQKLDSFEAEHKEVGKDFINVPPEQLIGVVREYLQMKLDDDRTRRLIEGTELVVPADGLPSTIIQVQRQLKDMVGQPSPDGDELNSLLSNARAAVPELHHLLTACMEKNPDILSIDAAKLVLEWLDDRLKRGA